MSRFLEHQERHGISCRHWWHGNAWSRCPRCGDAAIEDFLVPTLNPLEYEKDKQMDTDFDSKLEKHFEAWFAHELRDLRGTEVEIMNTKASAHKWYFAGAVEMRRIFQTVMIDQYRQWTEELDSAKYR